MNWGGGRGHVLFKEPGLFLSGVAGTGNQGMVMGSGRWGLPLSTQWVGKSLYKGIRTAVCGGVGRRAYKQ